MPYRIRKHCIQCERCAEACPLSAIDKDEQGNFAINSKECNNCGECVKVCSVEAIILEKRW